MTQYAVQLKDAVLTGTPEGGQTAPVGAERLQTDAAVRPARWRKLKGADAYGWARDAEVPRLVVSGAPVYTAYGDSFTVGTGASVTAKSFVEILAAALGAPSHTNQGYGGTGVLTAAVRVYADEAVPRTSGLTTVMAGFNDLRRGGASAKTLAKLQHCTRATLAACFAATATAASDASITKSGTWTAFTYAGKASALGGTAQTALSGATATATVTGDSCVIGFLATDGVTHVSGNANVTVDGTLVATITPNNGTDGQADPLYDNTIVPGALVLRGLGSGSHTVVVSPTDAANPFYLDWIGTLASPGSCAPVLVGMPPRMNATGYTLAPASASDAVMATGGLTIADIVAEFGDYPVRTVWPCTEYDITSEVSSDNIHPTDAGHAAIARAFLARVMAGTATPAPVSSGTLTLLNTWVTYDVSYTPAAYRAAGGLVRLEGLIKSGTMTSGTTICTLPVGFRPKRQNQWFAVATDTNGSAARLYVDTQGNVVIHYTPSNGYLALDGVSFLSA